MKLILSFLVLSSMVLASEAAAQELRYRATRLQVSGATSGEPGAISAGGTVVGIAYYLQPPYRRIFWQRGQSDGFLQSPILGSSTCYPRAVSESGSRVLIAGTCSTPTNLTQAWFSDGQTVRLLGAPLPSLFLTGLSSLGIVAGNSFLDGTPANPATLWNGADGSTLRLNGSATHQFAVGISDQGLVGLSIPPATYSVGSGRIVTLPLPVGDWHAYSSNEFTMSPDGTFAGTITDGLGAQYKIVLWRGNSIVREFTAPAACIFPNRTEWVAKTSEDRVIVGCRGPYNDGLYPILTPYVSLANGGFEPLSQRTSGLPAGHLSVTRHSSSSGMLVGSVEGDSGIWLLTPEKHSDGTAVAKPVATPCADWEC